MASDRRKKVVASRRRREDEGEDEGSIAEDLEDDSFSEGSVTSDGEEEADIEPSDLSEDEFAKANQAEQSAPQANTAVPTAPSGLAAEPQLPKSTFTPRNMMVGLKHAKGEIVEELGFDETRVLPTIQAVDDARPPPKLLKEMPVDRSRQDQAEYSKHKNGNPAFVPNRGSYFLHDNRAGHPRLNGTTAGRRGRGRGTFGNFQASRTAHAVELTDQPWAHDLHDSVTVSAMDTKGSNATRRSQTSAATKAPTVLPPSNHPTPNRSFSSSILLGKVPVSIHLPAMQEKRTVQNVAKKKHTLLPQHRPPLRRDKPVRVSLPDHQPRYIFPSTERSFIFIPRALRPNQQGYGRGRGRSSFTPSRRTSTYGGSAYTPSVGLSRRSSLGPILSRDGVQSPGAQQSLLSPSYVADPSKPVVRFPTAPRNVGVVPLPATSHIISRSNAGVNMSPGFQRHDDEVVANTLTMYQPRPQKTVSVADIESPARVDFNAPAQQQEQPFHQQMPVSVNPHVYGEEVFNYNARTRRLSHTSQTGGTPLSQIPERAIHAQPFQPYPLMAQGQGYLPAQYAPGAIFHPTVVQGDGAAYNSGVGPAGLPPAFVAGPPAYMMPATAPLAPGAGDGNVPTNATVAHESNGMVYYYESSQSPPGNGVPYSIPVAGALGGRGGGGVVGMGGMMGHPHHFYYPPANEGMYYSNM